MSRETSCFDLFKVYAKLVAIMEFNGGRPLDDRQKTLVWQTCVGNGRRVLRGRQTVQKARPVEIRELSIVKSCKRKVRW